MSTTEKCIVRPPLVLRTLEDIPAKAKWIDTEAEAAKVIEYVKQFDHAGYDSEFEGVDLKTQSCVGRSRLDVFSIAVPAGRLQPLGYSEPSSWIFEGGLIQCLGVKSYLEDGRFRKVIHNRPVDEHTARNAGVRIRGGLCTLNMARWVYPERANLPRGNFDLDSLCRWRVGFGKTEDFDGLLGYDDYVPYTVEVPKKFCVACQSGDCRKKKPPHDIREERLVEVTRAKRVRKIRELSSIRPDRNPELFARYLAYAAADAELASIIYQMMLRDGQKERAYPWGF